MKRIAYLLIIFFVITIAFLIGVYFLNNQSGKGALQVTSSPASQVFLNGKFIGKTPLCLCELNKFLDSGDYEVKLIPENNLQNFEEKVTIRKGILTVVDRNFRIEPGASSGSVITFSPINENESQLLVVSSPQGSKVILDNSEVGLTPLLLKDVTASDHELKILKDGYTEKTIRVKTVIGKKLEASVYLGIVTSKNASSSGVDSKAVVILDTPTGYLRVRQTNSVDSSQIATVSPGEKFVLLEEKDDWFKIKLKDGKTGWVSAAYASKE